MSYPPYPPDAADKHSAEAVVKSRLNGLPAPATAGQNEQPTSRNTDEQSADALLPHPAEPQAEPAPSHGEATQQAHFAVKPVEQQSEAYSVPNSKSSSTLPAGNSWGAESQFGLSSDVVYSYYPFLTISNLPNLPPQDVNFLELQGCLRVPTRALLDEFLQQYFLHVHPLLPLINEGDIWDMYCLNPNTSSGSERISLLLFQSILFASCNFVSKNSIKALGYPSIRAARAALYRRAKLLYDLESESSPLAISQSALLLSYWSPTSTRKPNTAWLSLAIQHAKSAEAHHYAAMPVFSASTHPLQRRKQNILKRLWWCCIIRDRTLGLLMRRPINITRAHFDFDANPILGFRDIANEFDRSKVYNADTKRCLAEVLAQLIELYVVLTDILMMVFPLDDTPGWGREMRPEDVEQVRECKTALRRWYKDATLRFPMFGGGEKPNAASALNKNFHHDSVILYTNLMYMYYHSTRVVLCHHEVLHLAILQAAPESDISRDLSRIYENRHELQDAASGVTECLKELVHRKLARWLPISAVACTALPLVLNILDVKLSASASSPDRDSSASSKQHRLNVLIEAMKTYQPQYDGVDWISEIVRHIVNLSQLDNTHPQDGTKPKIADWTDILASQPSAYLRLALALDLSLSKGRLPEDGDFPVSLRGLFTGGFSPLKALIEANRPNQSNGRGFVAPASTVSADASTRHHPLSDCGDSHSSPETQSDAHMSNPDDLANEALRDQIRSHMRSVRPENTNAPPSEGIAGLGQDMNGGAGVFGEALEDGSPSGSSEFGGMYIDGPMPDVSAEWIENLWDEMGNVEDKTDRDTARVLLEAMKDGDMGEVM